MAFQKIAALAAMLVSSLIAAGGSVSAQSLVRRHTPAATGTSGQFGHGIALLQDLDDLGLRDLAVTTEGGVRILSAETGAVLRNILTTAAPGTAEDATLVPLDDLDSDGIDDLMAGYPQAGPNERGLVEVYSVRTGRRLFVFAGQSDGWRLGSSIANAGDIDLDGVPDLAMGAPGNDVLAPGGGVNAGLVEIRSGATGSLLWQASFGGAFSECGTALAALGDLDGDGRPSLAIGSPGIDSVYIAEPLGNPGLVILSQPGNFGTALLRVDDLSGDGLPDLVVGRSTANAPLSGSDHGAVSAFSSTSGSLLWTAFGDFDDNRFGSHLGTAGDVDLDGIADIVAGGRGASVTPLDPEFGERSVISGIDGSVIPTTEISGGPRAFALAEDTNADGRADLWYSIDGEVRRLGNAATEITPGVPVFAAEDTGFAYGATVAMLDDLDGDGRSEVAIGRPHDPGTGFGSRGSVEIRSGDSVLATLQGSDANGEFGTAIVGLGDLDGDGIGDFAVGSPNGRVGRSSNIGVVTIHSGADRSVIRQHQGDGLGARFGAGLCRLPDADGDGIDDYAIGSPGRTTVSGAVEAGRVEWYSGAAGILLGRRDGIVQFGRLGASVTGSRDLDGDGLGDLVVGAPRDWTNVLTIGAGRVRCWSGGTGAELWSVEGSQSGMRLGTSVASVGDQNGDGVPDLLAGAPRFGALSIGDGRAELRSGSDGSLLWSTEGVFSSRVGTAVLGTGDLDNDGVEDFAIGEPSGLDVVSFERPGFVRLISGASRSMISLLRGGRSRGTFGSALAARPGDDRGDLDWDRATDLVVGDPGELVLGPRAEVWTARSIGSVPVGSGTDGCAGPTPLTLAFPARIGQTLELRFGPFAAGVLPLLFLGDAPTATPTPLLGASLHLNPLISLSLPPLVDAYCAYQLALPSAPGLIGTELSWQVFTLWPAACPQLPLGLSSTNALTVTLLEP